MAEDMGGMEPPALRYLSVCSGIEAATVAWHPLGFRPLAFSEIEPFPRAVLAHHYPDVPLHGDFTRLRDEDWIVGADILVGGCPCQAFSIAGLRHSLDDARGNLTLEFVGLADAIDQRRSERRLPPCIIVWENVPGVLSVRDNAFGCFLSGLSGEDTPFVPPRGKWTNAGVALGPARAVAWRILDAQFFRLAQRRRRVFVVASARAGFDPAAVLLEFEGVRRDTPPRRETGQDAAADARCSASVSSGNGWWSDSSGLSATLRAQDSVTEADTLVQVRAGERSHWDGAEHPHPTLNQSFNTGAIGYSNQELFSQRGAGLVRDISAARMVAFGEYAEDETASTVKSRDYKDATDLVAQCSTGDVAHCLNAGGMGRQDYETETLVTHALRGEGFDASEDGTGRGTPLVPVQAFYSTESRCDNFPPPDVSPPLKVGSNGGGQPPAIAFSAKDHGADASEDLSPTLRAMPHDGSHANGGGQMAVASPLDLRNAGRNPEKRDAVNRQGLGVGEDGDPSPTVSTAFVPGVAAYAFQTRIARNGRGDMGEVVNALTMSGETGKGDTAPCVAVLTGENVHAYAAKAGSAEALRSLRCAIGEKAFAIWGLGVLASLQSPEVLQSDLHGCGVRPAAFSRSWVVYCALSRQKDGSGWLLQSLRETGCEGCPPQGWQPSEQLARELGAYLSELSYPGPQAERLMYDLWRASEGLGLLRETLSTLQEMGRSAGHQAQSVRAIDQGRRDAANKDMRRGGMQCQVSRKRLLREACAAGGAGYTGDAVDDQTGDRAKGLGYPSLEVRRLTCEEAEFLQGFPRGYTRIPWKKKPADECPDGPRYKALGNSMAVNVMRWIGERIRAQLSGI